MFRIFKSIYQRCSLNTQVHSPEPILCLPAILCTLTGDIKHRIANLLKGFNCPEYVNAGPPGSPQIKIGKPKNKKKALIAFT